jgi:hypothetical protein
MSILLSDNNSRIAERDKMLLLQPDQFVSHLFGTGFGVKSQNN